MVTKLTLTSWLLKKTNASAYSDVSVLTMNWPEQSYDLIY